MKSIQNPLGQRKGKLKNLTGEEPETSGTAQTIEVSTIIPPVDSTTLSNQSNQSHQSVQSTVTSSPPHTQSGNLGRSMADEMRLPTFRGDGSEDPDNTGFSVKPCGVLRISPTKLSNELSSVLP
jgi:hypothetical protein